MHVTLNHHQRIESNLCYSLMMYHLIDNFFKSYLFIHRYSVIEKESYIWICNISEDVTAAYYLWWSFLNYSERQSFEWTLKRLRANFNVTLSSPEKCYYDKAKQPETLHCSTMQWRTPQLENWPLGSNKRNFVFHNVSTIKMISFGLLASSGKLIS